MKHLVVRTSWTSGEDPRNGVPVVKIAYRESVGVAKGVRAGDSQ